MTKYPIQIVLSVMDEEPSRLTKLFAVQPTSVYEKGSRKVHPPLPKRNGWHFKTGSMDYFRKIFEGKEDVIVIYGNNVSVTIIVNKHVNGFEVNNWMINFLSRINIHLDVEINYDLDGDHES